ncbi:uncharacterized protein [Enoplosus armatus]|uniref:uncharacterized protein n=1 Tax=Enoplosus armatus TaxID=215367 RepID=UPI003994126C
MLTCSVDDDDSSGWKYQWFRRTTNSSEEIFTGNGTRDQNSTISITKGGVYWCRGVRGDSFTEDSNIVSLHKIVSNRAVVTLQPNWNQIFSGETITLSGDYRCKGRKKRMQTSITEWSDAFNLRVYDNKPKPVLTVSPLWLSPGASVTLNCEVENPNAGWSFYWYKAVPKLSGSSYSFELLPDSSNGTAHGSHVTHGQTHTTGYVCRAGRGDKVYYTQYSEPKFVWSGGFHSSASLTVSPDRGQHFSSDSVSLSCEGNSTEWRVRKFTQEDPLLDYSDRGAMTGATSTIQGLQEGNTVYWCESGSGEFSNAVNITAHIILESPVHPVTEGDSVTLSCKLKTVRLVSNVFFYQNDKLIQNDTRGELNIAAVSKSDEGFYKCKYSRKESQQSWLTVKSSGSSSLVPVFTGLLVGIVAITLLLLMCHFTKAKDACCDGLVQHPFLSS